MGELLIELQADIDAKAGNLHVRSTPRGRSGKRGSTLRMFANHMLSTAPKHLRSAMSIVAWDVSERYARNMIVSTEGGGKTTAAIRCAGRFRLDDIASNFFGNTLIGPGNGFQIVAGSSYKQAREHFEAYRSWWSNQHGHAEIELPAPILLQSFSEHYRQFCAANDLTPLKYSEALKKGYNSLVAAVFAQQPQAFADITAIKNAAWRVTDENGKVLDGFHHSTRVLIFTTHAMAQDFNGPSLSKAWLHPDFDPANIDDPDAWIALANQFHLYRVIHDEASLADLVHIESAKSVKTAHKFRKLVKTESGKDWSKVSQSFRYQIFNDHGTKKMKKLGFHDLCRIINIGFAAEDLTTVDFHAHPFGINNSDDAMYIGTHGTGYYVKPRRWWMKQRARVLITTTEALVAKVASRINKNDDKHWIPQIKIHRLDDDEFVTPDSVRLRRDKRASKSKIDYLVQDRLADGIDFVISDMADGSHSVLSTHVSARGRNDLKDKHISTILTFLAKDEYCRLNVVAQRFGIDDIYQNHYRDQLNQAAGRNSGLRKNHATPYDHEVIVSPTLHRCLGGSPFFASGRYPAYLTP